MNDLKPQKKDWLAVLAICFGVLLLMLPRILSAQFGLLDDGVLVLNSIQSFRDATFILRGFSGAGRFIPTTLLFRAIAFYFSGSDPQRWYIWQTVILIVICLELAFIVRRYVPSRPAMFISVLFFLGSPALIENFYTLSKAEVYLLLCMSSAILISTWYTSLQNRIVKMLVIIASFTFLLLSFGTKETALVSPFIFFVWLLISRGYSRKNSEYRTFLHSDLILLAGSFVSGTIYLAVRHYVLELNNPAAYAYVGEYQLFNIPKILFNLMSLSGWLVRDYPYLLPVFLAAMFLRPLRQTKLLFAILRWTVWMIAWAAILLPWGYLGYYFLPFQFGAAVLSGIILDRMLLLLRSEHSSRSNVQPGESMRMTAPTRTVWVRVYCIATIILAVPPVINASAYATAQLTLDKANWQFVEQASELPPNSRLLINIPAEMEYFYEIQLFVGRILDRPDISIESFQAPVLLNPDQDTYIASPFFDNQVYPSVRSIVETSVDESWNAMIPVIDNSQMIYSDRVARPIFDIGLHRILFFMDGSDMMGYSERDIFTITTLVYGWDLWEYSP